ncbi:putative alkaline phosphatase D/APaseD PhoD [Vibrio nigripulchritudo SOn1]|uniref:Alkaline phosphatase D/APaseD PhoD n=1 Tax=Vibrio nigripulchritudo SOn1 TaxID=1238450 RepID=A0AAV2VN62_9VIBR|nr:alkaline phosphatase D/APaseD PhoD [Vibrio nigripulchritudo]CCO46168.1 putative alkaline phosphatase D/APaseD PhoD [Vibrio nigripulchritudo SOn1]
MSTSKWSLVIHDVGTHHARIWVGTLYQYLAKPEQFHVKVYDKPITSLNRVPIFEYTINQEEWERPFRALKQRFYKVVEVTGLNSNQTYYVDFVRGTRHVNAKTIDEHVVETGSLRTLPTSLSEADPFVVMMGSCYFNDDDEKGQAAKAYTHLYFNGEPQEKPHVKFLTGDQVYLDIGLDSLSPVIGEVHQRIAADYADTWRSNRKLYRHGGCWFLADDHEYWNNYPYAQGTNPYLWAITFSKKVKAAWTKSARDGVKRIQRVEPFRTFDVGDDLSFCFVDLRSDRDKRTPPKSMVTKRVFKQLIDWAKNLNKIGILVLPQPLIVEAGSDSDYNLANYEAQYKALWEALAHSGNDIVCLSGDVHFGRIANVKLGNGNAKLHEMISSPMSNITPINGGKYSAATPQKIKKLPSFIGGDYKVHYDGVWCTRSEVVSKWYMLEDYYQTKEHFMTLSFTRSAEGNVELDVQAWLVRDCDRTGKPKKQFSNRKPIVLSKRS